MTVRAFGQKWLKDAEAGLKRKTLKSYLDTLRHHIYPALGSLLVREVHQQYVASS